MQYDILGIFFIFVATSVVFRIIFKSWVTPPAFCTLYWTIFIGINLFFPEYVMLPEGLLYIAVVLWVFALSYIFITIINPRGRIAAAGQRRYQVPSRPFRIGLFITVGIGTLYVVIVQNTVLAVVEGVSLWVQLLLVSHFVSPILCGVLLGSGMLQPRDRWLPLLGLLPALTMSILYTGRTAFFGPALILATGYLCGTVIAHPIKTPLISWRRLVFVVVALMASSVYGTAIYVMRIARGEEGFANMAERISVYAASFDSQTWSSSYDKIRSHIYGQPSSFTYMYRDYFAQPSFIPRGGAFIFAGPLVILGIERPSHENYVTVENVETNVYTIFAPALEDFGVAGSFIWWALVGVISALSFRAAQKGSIAAACVLVILLMNFQTGANFLFRYNSVSIAYLVVIALGRALDRDRLKFNRENQSPISIEPRPPGKLLPPMALPGRSTRARISG